MKQKISSSPLRSSFLGVAGKRIPGIDLARAVGLMFLVIANLKLLVGGREDRMLWMVDIVEWLDGRGAALLLVTVGMGVSLSVQKFIRAGDPLGVREYRTEFIARGIVLFLVGLVCLTVWPADILHSIGLSLVLGALVINAPGWLLFALSVISLGVFAAMPTVFEYSHPWNENTLAYLGESGLAGFGRRLVVDGFFPLLPCVGYLTFGMWLGRLDYGRFATRWKTLVGSLLVIGICEGLRAVLPFDSMPVTPLFAVSALATAAFAMVVCVILADHFSHQLHFGIVTGQTVYTLYVLHIFLGMSLLKALQMTGGEPLVFSLKCAAVFVVVMILFGLFCQRFLGGGPIERLLRRLSPQGAMR